MNDVLTAIASRFSCRKYTGEPVEQEKLEQIATAGLQAPSALNKQPLKIIVIQDKALIEEMDEAALEHLKNNATPAYERILSRGGKVYYNAPAIFLVLKTPEVSQTAKIDAGISVQTMALAAASLEVNTVIAAMTEMPFVSEKAAYFKEKVGWPEGYEFMIGLIAGYGDMKAAPHAIDEGKIKYVG